MTSSGSFSATSSQSASNAAAKAKLQGALDQFKDARPAELDQPFLNSGVGKDKPEKKGKKKNNKKAE